MSTGKTRAALIMEEQGDNLSSHQVISLMYDAAIERVNESQHFCEIDDEQHFTIVLQKTLAIVQGLKEHLNYENGGDIAENFGILYEYIIGRLLLIHETRDIALFPEVRNLLLQLKSTWDGMPVEQPETV